MISRTSCAHRHASAMQAAQTSASSREGTSIIENPPITAFVCGSGPTLMVPSVATMADCWRWTPPPKIQTPAALACRTHRVRRLAHRQPVLFGNVVHRAVVERNQVPRHRSAPSARQPLLARPALNLATSGPHQPLATLCQDESNPNPPSKRKCGLTPRSRGRAPAWHLSSSVRPRRTVVAVRTSLPYTAAC